jgi:simple sugar transport system permease protein
MASWLAKFNPLAMIGSSAFIVFLNKGGDEMTTVFNTNDSLPNTIIGIVLFFLIGCEFFIGYRLKFRKFGKKGGNKQ